MNDGYTAQQIAEALRNDVFGILPKTITTIVRESGTSSARKRDAAKFGAKRRTSKTMEADAGKRAEISTMPSMQQKRNAPRLPEPGMFVIQNDSDDL